MVASRADGCAPSWGGAYTPDEAAGSLELDRRISHLLSFSRPAPYRPLQENVPRLIEGLLPTFAESLRERGVELGLDLPPQLPQVRVDPIQLEQALLEVVSNALDAMPSGGTLRISAIGPANNGGQSSEVTIEIADTGPGIPDDALGPGEELPEPPSDSEVERAAEALGAAVTEKLPLEGQ